MLKLFISYSHQDSAAVKRFVTHLAPLCGENGLLEVWYDQNILAGQDFWDEIDNHLADRDIVCLMLSADYLASKACQKEMQQTFAMAANGDVAVIPIILSDCGWNHYSEISSKLALPTDAQPLSTFPNADTAWQNVVNGVEQRARSMKKRRDLTFKPEFESYLDDASIFTKAHSSKSELHLSDIFIYPDLSISKDDASRPGRVSSLDVINGFKSGDRLIIVGEDQSGKTALAKVFVRKLRERNMIPVFIREKALQGNIELKLQSTFADEYESADSLSEYPMEYVIPVIDDFHKSKKRDKILEALSKFPSYILVVDEAFELDFTNNDSIIGLQRYHIREFKPTFRNKLIKNWLTVSGKKEEDSEFINQDYALIDSRSQMVEEFLGKALSQGIMPSYPFFILTALVTIDEAEKPLDNGITSQGYCYQSLIYFFLREQGVANDNIDSYINFLTEFAAELYHKNDELTEEEYNAFIKRYEQEFLRVEKVSVMEARLQGARIIRVSSFKNYSFEYPYLYYYFAGKYFAEQFENYENAEWIDDDVKNNTKDIDTIIDNLHVTDNAYIAIFIAHHSRNKRLIERLLSTGKKLFSQYEPATLSKEELSFFNTKPLALPQNAAGDNPDKVREDRLKMSDAQEERRQEIKPAYKDDDDDDSEISKEIRRSIKTVEVIGRILRNRTGSLRQSELTMMFKTGMNIHLRLLTSFFTIITDEEEKKGANRFLVQRIREANPNMDDEKVSQLAEKLFWNLNFGVIIGFLGKIIFSLGSDKLLPVVNTVAEDQHNEATFIIRQAISMYYKKNLQIGEIERMMGDPSVSEITKRLMSFVVSDYCQTHRIDYRDRSRLINIGFKPHLLNTRN